MTLSKTVLKMIKNRDAKCGCVKISDQINELFEKGRLIVGYRTTCGASGIDETQKDFSMFREVVKRLNKDGFIITEEKGEKQKNGYATNNGGFWDEKLFTLRDHNHIPDIGKKVITV